MVSMVGAAIVTAVAMVHIPHMAENLYAAMGKVYCIFWGFFIGWWYASEQLLFSFLLPAGQESELSGFYIYSMVLFTWFPPLLYSIILNQGTINEAYGLSSLMACQAMAFLSLGCLPPWPEALKSASIPLVVLSPPPAVAGKEEITIPQEVVITTGESTPP
jgi:MFS-type transporter involved in bile tolerance (Atg22 family)